MICEYCKRGPMATWTTTEDRQACVDCYETHEATVALALALSRERTGYPGDTHSSDVEPMVVIPESRS
jgi:hypothetical protein